MKKFSIILIVSLFFTQVVFSQITYTFKVTVYNNKGHKFANAKVWFHNKTTGEKIIKYTNPKGEANFDFKTAGTWTLNLIGMHDIKTLDLKDGVSGSGSKTLTYDLERKIQEQDFLRKRALAKNFKEIDQNKLKIDEIPKGNTKVTIKVKNDDLKKVNKINVSLISVNPPEKYTSQTNKDGEAIFLLPSNQIYAVDIEEAQNCSFTNVLKNQWNYNLELEFEPTVVNETIINDTITQILLDEQEPSSTRAYVEIKIPNYTNKNIYLTQIGTGKVFSAISNYEGKVAFLLPNGYNYMLDLKYQPNVDVINLDNNYGKRTVWQQFIWSPLPELQYPEQFLPSPDNPHLIYIDDYNTEKISTEQQVDFFVKWGNNTINPNSKEAILQLNIVVNDEFIKDDNQPAKKQPLNLAFVVDISGSMGYDIDAIKESMILFVAQLSPEDNVTLITFNGNAYLEVPFQPVGDGENLKNNISDIQVEGGTNIYNGLVMGYEELLKNFAQNRTNTLILFSDGYGCMPVDTVLEKSKYYNKKGIGISAIMLEGYNTGLLTLLTQESKGVIRNNKGTNFIENFTASISNSIFPIVTDAKIEIQYNNSINYEKLFGFDIFENNPNTLTINIGELYLNQNKVALIKFNLKNIDKTIPNKPVKINLSYKNYKDEQITIEKEIALEWEQESGKYEKIVEEHQKKLYSIAIMNQAIKVMTDQFSEAKPKEAKQTLIEAQKKVLSLYNNKITDKDVNDVYNQIVGYITALDNFIKK